MGGGGGGVRHKKRVWEVREGEIEWGGDGWWEETSKIAVPDFHRNPEGCLHVHSPGEAASPWTQRTLQSV